MPSLRRAAYALCCLVLSWASPAHAAGFKVLHVMSYHAGWEWNREQFDSFKAELKDQDVTYRVVELDAKRLSPEAVQARAAEAVDLIETWKPDLVYANDDLAQELVTRRFAGAKVPIVFSGVNRAPAVYGFDKAGNVTGVLEQEHFTATLRLLQAVRPGARRLAIVTDQDPTWEGVQERIRGELRNTPGVRVVAWLQPRTFEEYKKQVMAMQTQADAIATLGVFNFTGPDGKYVDYETVLRWTVEHSRLPDFSFWDTRVQRGTLCAVTVSGIEQGREAGRMARRILVQGVAPDRIAPTPTTKGRPMISLARARALNIKVPASTLLSSEVLTAYAWER